MRGDFGGGSQDRSEVCEGKWSWRRLRKLREMQASPEVEGGSALELASFLAY
jgi:hypothetical protein